MLIVISGQPHSGKSTLLQQAMQQTNSPCYGFVTLEQQAEGQKQRSGFELVSSDGHRARLAGIDVTEGPKVSRYRVDVASLDRFLTELREPKAGEIAYIDEVGEMEFCSNLFEPLLSKWIKCSDMLICTVSEVYQHQVIDDLKREADHVIALTEANRARSLSALSALLKSSGPAVNAS